MEKQSGYYLKSLTTDRGREFYSNEFLQFCKDFGLRRQLATDYTPQQNGVVEWKNRIVANMTRRMLQTKKLSNVHWAEAIRTAIYILNRSCTSSLDGITPYEAWYDRKPNVNHFKVFGCLVFVHVPKKHKRKLDPIK